MAAEWMQEEKDRQTASRLARALEDEDKAARNDESVKGERAALALAMEERRRIVNEAKEMKDQLERDQEYARRCVIDDVEEDFQFKEACKEDEDLAKRLHEQLQDEMFAAELQEAEMKADMRIRESRKQIEAADAELAEKEQEMLRKEMQLDQARQEEKDSACASMLQEYLTAKVEYERQCLEMKDAVYAQTMQIKQSRDDHRHKKRAEMMGSVTADFGVLSELQRQWDEAVAECEDVAGGICITILLPHLCNLKVFTVDEKTVEIDARRSLQEGEDPEASSAQYCAEFIITGKDVNVEDRDISYEYSSEAGLLFVYVEKVKLDPVDPAEAVATAAAKGSSGKDDKSRIVAGKGARFMGAIKKQFDGFSRIFKGSHNKSRK